MDESLPQIHIMANDNLDLSNIISNYIGTLTKVIFLSHFFHINYMLFTDLKKNYELIIYR